MPLKKKFTTQCKLNPNHKHCEHSGGPGHFFAAPAWVYDLSQGIPCEGFGGYCPPPYTINPDFCKNNPIIPCGCELPKDITEEELKIFREFVLKQPLDGGGIYNGDPAGGLLSRTKPCGEGPNFVLMEILLQMVLVGMRIIRVDVVKLKYDALQMVALYVMDFIQIVL